MDSSVSPEDEIWFLAHVPSHFNWPLPHTHTHTHKTIPYNTGKTKSSFCGSTHFNWPLPHACARTHHTGKTKSGFCACAVTFQLVSTTYTHTHTHTPYHTIPERQNLVSARVPPHLNRPLPPPPHTHTHTHTPYHTRKTKSGFCACAITFQLATHCHLAPSLVGAGFSSPVQTDPGAHQASYMVGNGSFLGVEQLGCGVGHPPPSSAKVNARVELYLYSTAVPLWHAVRVNFTW